jgi:hypothetical protein
MRYETQMMILNFFDRRRQFSLTVQGNNFHETSDRADREHRRGRLHGLCGKQPGRKPAAWPGRFRSTSVKCLDCRADLTSETEGRPDDVPARRRGRPGLQACSKKSTVIDARRLVCGRHPDSRVPFFHRRRCPAHFTPFVFGIIVKGPQRRQNRHFTVASPFAADQMDQA